MNPNTNNRTTAIRLSLLLAIALATPMLLTTCEHRRAVETQCETFELGLRQYTVRDFEYTAHAHFDLGRVGTRRWWTPGDSIISFDLFVVREDKPDTLRGAIVYRNWFNREGDPNSVSVFAEHLPGNYYALSLDSFVISVDPGLGHYNSLAYSMTFAADTGIVLIGDTSSSPIELQFLRSKGTPPDEVLEDLTWKNLYRLPRIPSITNGMTVEIYRGEFGDESNARNLYRQDGVSFVELLGIDRVGDAGLPPPDGIADMDSSTVDFRWQLLVFPQERPFASTLLNEPAEAIYSEYSREALESSSRYYLVFTWNEIASWLELEHRYLIPESETVEIDGVPLVRGRDYYIDYNGGISLHYPDTLPIPSTLHICYDYAK